MIVGPIHNYSPTSTNLRLSILQIKIISFRNSHFQKIKVKISSIFFMEKKSQWNK